ncbi:MAG TPA: META domain-containing protein [Nocardioidaceae bacterium]|nr:META domain-containing protein [Nocardioidaceae bacterium]
MRPTAMRSSIALLPALLILAACGEQTAVGGAGEPAATLDGRTFVGDQVDGHDLVPGSSLRLSFEDGNVGVNAGCNHLSGKARLDNGVLRVSHVGGTEMGCEPDLMDQDTWIADFLQSSPDVTVDDRTLALSKEGVTVTLTDEASIQAENPIALEGTTWKLESIITGDAASSVPGKTPTLRIAEGRYELFTGCNRGGGTVNEATGSVLTLSAPALTKMACKDSAEPAVLAVIDGSPLQFEQDYDVLTLTAEDGSGLQFRAAS